MTHIPIKRDKYLLGDFWKDKHDRVWKIIGIADSKFGAVFRISNGRKQITLSLDTINIFLKTKST